MLKGLFPKESNIWVVEFGMIACGLLLPLALICGPLRGIPPFWIAIDCSFGVFGVIPLVLAHRQIKRLLALPSAPRPAGPLG